NEQTNTLPAASRYNRERSLTKGESQKSKQNKHMQACNSTQRKQRAQRTTRNRKETEKRKSP
ncbi:hypothetical protein ABG818_05835, partial [Bifidobacterium adolescentis]